MRKKVIYLGVICSLLVINTTGCNRKTEAVNVPISKISISSESTDKALEHSQEEIYQDIFVTLLAPYIQTAINDYYKQYLTTSPNYSPDSIEIIEVERPMGYRSFLFALKLQVKSYIGPHLDVGVDQLTIRVGSGEGEVKVEKFEHVKSYYDSLPPNYKGVIKKIN
ncbi:DUF3888 domain-containing protein [Desulfosporosinus sp. OT]|uniref:DUF3888 domain-containing protein n=1 Tax=Desulfosporosinus sp. OT TaxID=913865 RepID=UPI000223B299|nr:DUF3888 domain-containing protein [Desulfosporosinus sp. OT]EGW37466.1 hypothetical protein DOT_4695 [Desulfosporosinus sp. OT]